MKGKGAGPKGDWDELGSLWRGDANCKSRKDYSGKYSPSSSEFAISFSTPNRPMSRLMRESCDSNYSDPFSPPSVSFIKSVNKHVLKIRALTFNQWQQCAMNFVYCSFIYYHTKMGILPLLTTWQLRLRGPSGLCEQAEE